MVHRLVLEHSGDPHFVRFESEGQGCLREFMAHNFVAWTPLLHRGAGRDISEHFDFQRRLTIGWINGECEIHRSMNVVLLDEVGFLSLSHFFPSSAGPRPVGQRYRQVYQTRSSTSVPGTRAQASPSTITRTVPGAADKPSEPSLLRPGVWQPGSNRTYFDHP